MKQVTILSIIMLLTYASFSQTYVHGYFKSNGTYVEPHYRSSPNNTKSDNWSTYGNINPYTGELGTKTYNDYNNWGYIDRKSSYDSPSSYSREYEYSSGYSNNISSYSLPSLPSISSLPVSLPGIESLPGTSSLPGISSLPGRSSIGQLIFM
jgi:hypothetical protein